MALTGCGRKAGVIFDLALMTKTWLAAPEQARISYVGQLTSSADLKPDASFFEVVGETLFGRESAQTFLSPFAICTDGKHRLFVADSNSQLVHIIDFKLRKYAPWMLAGDEPPLTQPVNVACGPGEFWLPSEVHIDPRGRIWTADVYNRRVQVFNYVSEGSGG